MTTVRRTRTFNKWLEALRDRRAKLRIETRVDRLIHGNAGSSRSVGHGVVELKIDYGPGYRVYFIQRGNDLLVLLCGGDKSSQSKDIALAITLANEWTEGENHGA